MSRTLARSLLLFAIPATALLSAAEGWADVTDLSRGAPLQIEDTQVAKKGEIQLQLPLHYEKARKDEDNFEFLPQLQIGLTNWLQLEISTVVRAGSGEQTGTGNVDLRLLAKVWEERAWLPSMALATEVELPTGLKSHGAETTLWYNATKALSSAKLPPRVHLNVAWRHHFDAPEGDKMDRYEVVAGYDHSLGAKTLLMADIDVEQQEEQGVTYKLAEVGLRQEISHDAIVGIGIGTGLDSHSPNLRLSASLEISF